MNGALAVHTPVLEACGHLPQPPHPQRDCVPHIALQSAFYHLHPIIAQGQDHDDGAAKALLKTQEAWVRGAFC